MKLKRSTVILMITALALTGFVYIFEIQGKVKQEQVKAKQQQLFSFPKEELNSFTITTPVQTISLERVTNPEEVKKSAWKITSPVQEFANEAAVDYFINELLKNQSIASDPTSGIQNLTVFSDKLLDYGLDKPQHKLELQLKNQTTHQLFIGKPDFRGDSLYAQLDPNPTPPKTIQILTISDDILTALNRPVEEWKITPEQLKQAEEKNKPTPTPSPTLTPTPTSSPTPAQ